ncbi:hypothetical protein ACFL6R_07470 [Gemmatimonadota bacterium]
MGWLSAAVIRLFSARSSARAIVRPGSKVESGLVGGVVPPDSFVFDGWAYRMGARFAGRVRIAIYPDSVAVAGPRVPLRLYKVWVWLQSLLLAAVFPVLAAAIVLLDWRYLLWALCLFVFSFAVSMGGAGMWPGLGELVAEGEDGHLNALEFPRDAIREVDIGKGWSKGGFGVILFPYKAGIDKMANGRAVSFFAPDETGREVRFALDMYSKSKADELAVLLRSTDPDRPT